MQQIVSALKLAFRRNVFVLGLVSLLSFTGFFAIAPQAVYAAPTAAQSSAKEAVISPDSQPYASREEAYEKALEAANDPKGLEKEYEKDLKIFKEENPDKANLIEEAKAAIDKVTGKD